MQIKANRRGDKWSVLIDLPRENGIRSQKRFTADTKTEAEKLARDYLTKKPTKQSAPDSRSFGELLDKWLSSVRETIESRTYASYDGIVRLYLRPQLGAIRVSELTTDDIEKAKYEWMSAPRRDKRKGAISATTVRYVLRTLRMVLQFGVERKWLSENPASLVKPPRASESEKRPLEADEVRALLAAAKQSSIYVPVLVALYSGVRRGELLGLKWSDIDFQERAVTVRRALEVDRLDGYSVKEKAPKSESSARTIPLPASVVDELRRYKVSQAERLLADGYRQSADTLVFDRGDGGPWHPDTFGQTWIGFANNCGVRRVRFHDLRSTFASLLIEAGVDPVTVQHFLGHSSLNLTMKVYARATMRAKRGAAERLEASLGVAL